MICPELLKANALRQKIEIFVCGPGSSSVSYSVRENVKSFLSRYPNTFVVYGEEIPKLRKQIPRDNLDLQTLESRFAHTVDFTVLLVDSPGSIAELGTFTMIDNIRPRLFALVPSNYFKTGSYISRGPLSLLSLYSPNNVIYYDPQTPDQAHSSLKFSLCMFKFAKNLNPIRYETELKQKFKSGEQFSPKEYRKTFDPIREQFIRSAVLAVINVIRKPTFSDIIISLSINPRDVTSALRELFRLGSIKKTRDGRYEHVRGFRDPLLSNFNSTALSQLRSRYLCA